MAIRFYLYGDANGPKLSFDWHHGRRESTPAIDVGSVTTTVLARFAGSEVTCENVSARNIKKLEEAGRNGTPLDDQIFSLKRLEQQYGPGVELSISIDDRLFKVVVRRDSIRLTGALAW